MIKPKPTKRWCSVCDSKENVTEYEFTRFTTSVCLCLGCRKKMAILLEED